MTILNSKLFSHGAARLCALVAATLLVASCALPLPDRPVRPDPYDLGPSLALPAGGPSGLPLGLDTIQAPASVDSTRVMYRLLYAGSGQQPRAYARARWIMPPAQMLTQRLRQALSASYPVLDVGSGLAAVELHIELDEFSQQFTSPQDSDAVVRLRATAVAPGARQQRLLGQRSFEVRHPAPSADAPGGAQALGAASDAVVTQLADWLEQLLRSGFPG